MLCPSKNDTGRLPKSLSFNLPFHLFPLHVNLHCPFSLPTYFPLKSYQNLKIHSKPQTLLHSVQSVFNTVWQMEFSGKHHSRYNGVADIASITIKHCYGYQEHVRDKHGRDEWYPVHHSSFK